MAIGEQLLDAARRLNRPRARRARNGIGKGFVQVGGAGLLLPDRIAERRRDDPEHTRREAELLLGLTLSGVGGTASFDAAIQARSGATGAEALEVRIRSIDEHVAAGMPAPAFIKIDVEGLEDRVLAGAAATLRSARPRLFVEMHGADEPAKHANARAVVGRLVAAGYELRHVQSGTRVGESNAEVAARGHLFCTPA